MYIISTHKHTYNNVHLIIRFNKLTNGTKKMGKM